MHKNYIFTSESVSEGHPDKVADAISDSILDAYLTLDNQARVACETMTTKDLVVIAGEINAASEISKNDIEDITRQTIKEIGYDQPGFHWETLKVQNVMHAQSSDIAMGVDASEADESEGAGDQGIMFGYACDDTKSFMPAPIHYAHKLLRNLSEKRKSGEFTELLPDAKAQVSVEYKDDQPHRVTDVVLSTQHSEKLSQQDVKDIVLPLIKEALPERWLTDDINYYINPTGRFVIGGPVGDAGLTGRKIIVDTYGGYAPHGGGAFSGKDYTKVDRSAAYVARYLAKNAVAAGLAKKCLIQLSYAIGVPEPVSIFVNSFGTATVDENKLGEALRAVIPLTPRGIRNHLQLDRPIYKITSSYGHFGRLPSEEGHFSWEKTDIVDQLRSMVE